jgi:hypothetical protein
MIVLTSIKKMCDNGGNTRLHMPWDECVQQAELLMLHRQQTVIKRPGYDFSNLADYEKEFGSTVCQTHLGHVPFKLGDEDGFLVPDGSKVKIEFNEVMEAVTKKTMKLDPNQDPNLAREAAADGAFGFRKKSVNSHLAAILSFFGKSITDGQDGDENPAPKKAPRKGGSQQPAQPTTGVSAAPVRPVPVVDPEHQHQHQGCRISCLNTLAGRSFGSTSFWF